MTIRDQPACRSWRSRPAAPQASTRSSPWRPRRLRTRGRGRRWTPLPVADIQIELPRRAVDATLAGSLEQQAWARWPRPRPAQPAGAARIDRHQRKRHAPEIDQQQADRACPSGWGGPPRPLPELRGRSLRPSAPQRTPRRFAAAAGEADFARPLALTGTADAWFVAGERRARAPRARALRTGEQFVAVTLRASRTAAARPSTCSSGSRSRPRAELLLRGAGERALNQLAVLTGRPPQEASFEAPGALPALPPLPELDVPGALLARRPDLNAAFQRLAVADRDLAAAVAARSPRLALSASYNFDAAALADLFDRTISVLTASLVAPVVDGGQRRAEVERARDRGGPRPESGLPRRAPGGRGRPLGRGRAVERITALRVQRRLATEEVEQARRRYVGGVDTYLPVLAAVTNLRPWTPARRGARRCPARAGPALRALGGAGRSPPRPTPRTLPDPVAMTSPSASSV